MMKALHITCVGTVQGVGFRYFTKIEADKYKLLGRVKNQEDGTVDILVKGNKEDINSFLKWCHVGPKTGNVDKLIYEIIDPKLVNQISFIIER